MKTEAESRRGGWRTQHPKKVKTFKIGGVRGRRNLRCFEGAAFRCDLSNPFCQPSAPRAGLGTLAPPFNSVLRAILRRAGSLKMIAAQRRRRGIG